MNEKIISLMGEINAKVSEISDLVELDKLRVAYLGKKGSITALLKGAVLMRDHARGRLQQIVRGHFHFAHGTVSVPL